MQPFKVIFTSILVIYWGFKNFLVLRRHFFLLFGLVAVVSYQLICPQFIFFE